MNIKKRASISVLLCLAFLGCAPGGGGTSSDDEEEPLPVEEEATPSEEEVAFQTSSENIWTCGSVKQHVHTVVNNLFEAEEQARSYAWANAIVDFAEPAATEDNESVAGLSLDNNILSNAQSILSGGENIDPEVDPDGAAVWSSFEASRAGFTSADQAALNAACEYYGQHQAALELWAQGNRGDACDVWIPAKQRASEQEAEIDITVLHPITSKFWAGATGDISEGYGKCIAERAN